MDEEREIILREWEQRYESYRAYTRLYLTVISVTVTGYIVAMSLVLSLGIVPALKTVLLALITVFLSAVLAAHRPAIREFNRLGERLNLLENQLSMKSYPTVTSMTEAVRISRWGTGVVWAVTLALTIYFLVTAIQQAV